MKTLILQLVAPLQSWGDESKLSTRQTRNIPSKSAVIGMIAAALGRTRDASVEDLMQLQFGVRVDQQGTHLRDFHTAEFPGKQTISQRYYLSDWKFLCVLRGEDSLVEQIAEALQSPVWPLFLGRRSCPPSAPVFVGITDDTLQKVLDTHPWIAAEHYRRSSKPEVRLLWARDVLNSADPVSELRSDHVLSFDSSYRRFKKRAIVQGQTTMENPDSYMTAVADGAGTTASTDHDVFALLGGE